MSFRKSGDTDKSSDWEWNGTIFDDRQDNGVNWFTLFSKTSPHNVIREAHTTHKVNVQKHVT